MQVGIEEQERGNTDRSGDVQYQRKLFVYFGNLGQDPIQPTVCMFIGLQNYCNLEMGLIDIFYDHEISQFAFSSLMQNSENSYLR